MTHTSDNSKPTSTHRCQAALILRIESRRSISRTHAVPELSSAISHHYTAAIHTARAACLRIETEPCSSLVSASAHHGHTLALLDERAVILRHNSVLQSEADGHVRAGVVVQLSRLTFDGQLPH
jgi:hypothetical protein